MNSLTMDPPNVVRRFDELCTLVGARGRGLTMRDLAHALALARELESPERDRGKIGDHAHALGLDVGVLT